VPGERELGEAVLRVTCGAGLEPRLRGGSTTRARQRAFVERPRVRAQREREAVERAVSANGAHTAATPSRPNSTRSRRPQVGHTGTPSAEHGQREPEPVRNGSVRITDPTSARLRGEMTVARCSNEAVRELLPKRKQHDDERGPSSPTNSASSPRPRTFADHVELHG
jgi:hypothetical protein